jgi:ribose 5-phosphate isomerase B
MKQHLKDLLAAKGHEVTDHGAADSQPSDYPDAGYAVAKAVRDGEADRGVLMCGSGIGMCITANKVRGIRAALCHDEMTAELSRRHNNTNVLCLPADLIGDTLMKRIVEVWLDAPFDGGRHGRRVEKILAIEKAEHDRPSP